MQQLLGTDFMQLNSTSRSIVLSKLWLDCTGMFHHDEKQQALVTEVSHKQYFVTLSCLSSDLIVLVCVSAWWKATGAGNRDFTWQAVLCGPQQELWPGTIPHLFLLHCVLHLVFSKVYAFQSNRCCIMFVYICWLESSGTVMSVDRIKGNCSEILCCTRCYWKGAAQNFMQNPDFCLIPPPGKQAEIRILHEVLCCPSCCPKMKAALWNVYL